MEYLAKNKHIELAEAIATSMELKEKGNIISGELYQRQFDTIVTSKLVEERQQVAPNAFKAMTRTSMAHYDLMDVQCERMVECCEAPRMAMMSRCAVAS